MRSIRSRLAPLVVFSVALLAGVVVRAEDDPARAVRWTWTLEPANAAPGSAAELVITAALAEHWVVYSSDFKAELGPQPVRLVAPKDAPPTLLAGPLRSIDAHRKHDKNFDVDVGYFTGRAELRQRVQLPADGTPLVATLRGQACNEADGTCHLLRETIRLPNAPADGSAKP
ncbi:MAG TPA: protein-disulfide reductase DsbD domain-containing protein [Steroidobacteraceae bacterium]|nr:protein-disulfide reductase DsbD domain-containing protein [Steroidobacteraceae bacterium]